MGKNINVFLDDEEEKDFDRAQALLSGQTEKQATQKDTIVILVRTYLHRKVKKNGEII